MYMYQEDNPYGSDEEAILAMAERKKKERIAAKLREQRAFATQLEHARPGPGTETDNGRGPIGAVVSKWHPDYATMGGNVAGFIQGKRLDPKIEEADVGLTDSTLRAGPFGGNSNGAEPVGTGTVLAPPGVAPGSAPPQGGIPAPFSRATQEQGPSATGVATSGTNSSPDFDRLVKAVMMQESRGNPNAVSSAGARGLMQIMPKTNRDPGYGVAPARDDSPAENMRVGRDYLAAMLRKYKGDEKLALAAYNAGPGRLDKALDKAGGNVDAAFRYLAPETQKYPGEVLARMGDSTRTPGLPYVSAGMPPGGHLRGGTPTGAPDEQIAATGMPPGDGGATPPGQSPAGGVTLNPEQQSASETLHPANFTDQQKRLYYMAQMGVDGAQEAFAKSIMPPDPTAATENEKLDQYKYLMSKGISEPEARKAVFGNEGAVGKYGAPVAGINGKGERAFFRPTPEGGMEEVVGPKPGMTEAQEVAAGFKRDAIAEKRHAKSVQRDTAVADLGNITASIARLRNTPGFKKVGTTTGIWQERLGSLAGVPTDVAGAQADMQSVRSGLRLATIGSLKALSPTGATGFGPLSDKEGQVLESAVAVVESSANSPIPHEKVEENLKVIEQYVKIAQDRINSGVWKPPSEEDEPGAATGAEWVRGPDGKLTRKGA